MESLQINFNLEGETHYCTSFMIEENGEFIIEWRCPICEQYRRTYNLSTGKMLFVSKLENSINHTGMGSQQNTIQVDLTKNLKEQQN